MIQFQLDHLDIAREVLLHIEYANMQTHHPGVASVPILGLNYHFHPPEGSLSMECMHWMLKRTLGVRIEPVCPNQKGRVAPPNNGILPLTTDSLNEVTVFSGS